MANVVAVSAWLVGCASLDPTGDIAEVSVRVESRVGVAADWKAPWDEESPAWDGRQDLSSEAAVIVAVQNNREIRQQVESIVASRADFVQAHLLPNPVITLAYGFPIDGGGGSPMAASLIQQLAWLWQRPARVDAAQASLEQRVLAVSDAVLRLVTRARVLHSDLVHAERAVQLQEMNCELVAQSLELVERRFEVGEASQLDVNRVRLDWLKARSELVERRRVHDVAKRSLLEHMARADAGLEWKTDGMAADPRRAEIWAEDELMAAASRLRLDVAAARVRINAEERRVELAERGAWPDVGGGVGCQQNFAKRDAVSPTVVVTPKLFDDNRARIARAKSDLEWARIESDRVWQQAQREARTAWVDLHASLDLIGEHQMRIVELSETNAALAGEMFAAGTVDLSVLLEAQRQHTSARSRLNDLQAEAARRFFELERAVGGTLRPEFIQPQEEAGGEQAAGELIDGGSSS